MAETARIIQFPASRSRNVQHWVTKRDLAKHLGVSERWIEYRMQEGMPHLKDERSRLVRFRVPAVEDWLQNRRRIG